MPSRRTQHPPTHPAKILWTRYVPTLLSKCLHARPPQQALIHATTVFLCTHDLALSLLVARPGVEATARPSTRQVIENCKSIMTH